MTTNEILSLSITDLAKMLAKGDLCSVDITSAYLDHASARNPEINCYIRIEAESALNDAERADANRRAGKTHPLCGIPIAIKDIFQRPGATVSAGSREHGMASTVTATVVQKLSDAGLPILGVLALDEFAAGGSGINTNFGRCRNPINTDYLSGGSSSGSAAAVSARMAPCTVGSDAGGSIRLPAGWCGVVGLKPTYGRVSRHGVIPRTWSMDCIGPLTRDASSCALLLDIISGNDGLDNTMLSGKQQFSPLSPIPDQRIRIGVVPTFSDLVGVHQKKGLSIAEDCFRGDRFDVAETTLPDIQVLNDLHQVIVKCEGASYLAPLLLSNSHQVSNATQKVVQEGFDIPASSYLSALRLRRNLLKSFLDTAFANVDVILMPLCPDDVPRSDHPDIHRLFSRSALFTRFVNYLGLPAITFPVCQDGNGLPVSVQLLGKPRDEYSLLNLAYAFEQRVGETLRL